MALATSAQTRQPAAAAGGPAPDTALQQQQSTLNTRAGDIERVYSALGYISLGRTWADFNGMIFAPDKVIRDFQHRDSTQSVTVVNATTTRASPSTLPCCSCS